MDLCSQTCGMFFPTHQANLYVSMVVLLSVYSVNRSGLSLFAFGIGQPPGRGGSGRGSTPGKAKWKTTRIYI